MTKVDKEHVVVKTFIVKNDRGLHTRPSTEIVKCASRFKCEMKLKYHRMEVSAKSLLDILMLAAGKNAKITVEARGVDAEEAVEALLELAKQNFLIQY